MDIIVLVCTKPVNSQHQIVPFFLRNEEKLACEIQKNAGRRIANPHVELLNYLETALFEADSKAIMSSKYLLETLEVSA